MDGVYKIYIAFHSLCSINDLDLFCWLWLADKGGLVQERRNSIAKALELCLTCTNPPIFLMAFNNISWDFTAPQALNHSGMLTRNTKQHLQIFSVTCMPVFSTYLDDDGIKNFDSSLIYILQCHHLSVMASQTNGFQALFGSTFCACRHQCNIKDLHYLIPLTKASKVEAFFCHDTVVSEY